MADVGHTTEVTEFKVFISSPSDVETERARCDGVLARLNTEFAGRFKFTGIRWEQSFYTADKTFQAAIPQPSSCDIVVCILWKRLGSELPEEYNRPDGTSRTGTEYEFEEALEAALRGDLPDILVYKKRAKIFFEAERVEQEQADLRALNAFWQRWFRDENGHFTAGFDGFDTSDEFADKLGKHLRLWLEHRSERVTWPIAVKGSPFRSLEPFEAEHAEVFFGRLRAIRQIVARLQTGAIRGCAFLVAFGMSGVGKSSLIRAGVLPWLVRGRAVTDIDEWRHCVVRPRHLADDPVRGLAAALFEGNSLPELAQGDHVQPESLAVLFRRSPESAVAPVAAALRRAGEGLRAKEKLDRPVEVRLLLVIDQLEEIFSLSDEPRTAIISLMDVLARSGQVWVIATLRNDFYPEFQANAALLRLKDEGSGFDVQAPGVADIREIIQGPVRAAGLTLEQHHDRSLGDLLEAAAQEPGSLPLLQFTLETLFQSRGGKDGKTLLLEAYDALGGLEGAIAREAEKLVAGLPPPLREALPGLLLALVEVDEQKEAVTARTIRRDALLDVRHIELADRLIAGRFVVADGSGEGAMLRLAHEALLAHWPTLATLIRDDFRFLGVRRRLQGEAAAWERHGRHADFLLPPGLRLAEAADALDKRRADLDHEIIAYAEASLAAEHERVASAQRAKEAALQRDLARSRRIIAVVSVLLLLAVGAGVFAWRERGVAESLNRVAEDNYRIALNQATVSLQTLKDRFDAGTIPTDLLQSLLEQSQSTVKGLSGAGDTDEVIAARIKLIDVVGLIEVSAGDSRAIETATSQNKLADSLKAKDPANPEWLRLWSIARGRLSDALFWQCDCVGALQRAQEGAEGAAQYLAAHPDDDYMHDRLLGDYQTMGDSARTLGDLDRADAAYQAWLKDAEAAAARQPGEVRWLADLAFAYERIGDQLEVKGNPVEAAAQYQAYLDASTKMVKSNPRDANFLAALAQSHERLGDSLLARGDATQALAEYNQFLILATRLVERCDTCEAGSTPVPDGSNFRFRELVARAYQRIGEASMQQQDLARAAENFDVYLRKTQESLAKDQNNNGAIYDVANAYEKLGDVRRAQGDLAGALKAYQDSLSFAAKLPAERCQNGVWMKILALGHQRLGLTLTAQGDAAGARKEFEQCAAIPVKPTVWTPEALSPTDVTAYCTQTNAPDASQP
jgi:tetratricopeptide (TPR) repeat protein